MTTKYLHISSRNRMSGSKSDFSINIPSDVFDKNVNSVKLNLQELTLNYSWYNVSEENENNTFLLYSAVDHTEYLMTIETGSYNVTEFKNHLNVLLENEYVVSYNTSTNKYTFTASDPANKIDGSIAGQFLGLESGVEHTGSFSSTKPVDMTYIDTIYLHSDIANLNNNFDNLSSNTMSQSTILARIPITVAPFSNINYINNLNTNEGIKIAGNIIDTIRFFLTDDRGNRLNITTDYTLVIKLEMS